jgi:tetratricopeptide (TPR) repeat protein
MEITAKIVLEDGSPLKSSPLISSQASGFVSACDRQQSFLDGTLRLSVPPVFRGGERQMGCYLSVTLPGYRRFFGFVQDGTLISMRRLGPNEGSSVSMASLNAPAAARKQYESGENAAAKRKWSQAEEYFREAVSIYPQYAMAWSELGQALQEEGHLNDAEGAFNKAREADPLYSKPVVQLAAAASLEQRWNDEMRLSEEALRMRPVEFPAVYFYHAEATYHLGKLEDAEQLTREAIGLDPGGTCPESMVLLGSIFEKQGNPHDALVEYRAYVKLAPHGARAQQAKNAIARLK